MSGFWLYKDTLISFDNLGVTLSVISIALPGVIAVYEGVKSKLFYS